MRQTIEPFYLTDVDRWLNQIPVVACQLPPDEHLPFLVQLFVELEKAGIPLEQHLECAIEGLILEDCDQ